MDKLCVHCGKDTAAGSNRFDDRLPTDDGYACGYCAGYSCDRCERQIYLNADVTADECGGGDEFADGAVHVCEQCLTTTERKDLINAV